MYFNPLHHSVSLPTPPFHDGDQAFNTWDFRGHLRSFLWLNNLKVWKLMFIQKPVCKCIKLVKCFIYNFPKLEGVPSTKNTKTRCGFCIHIMEIYSAIKSNKPLTQASCDSQIQYAMCKKLQAISRATPLRNRQNLGMENNPLWGKRKH
jgi:hypothetical protein